VKALAAASQMILSNLGVKMAMPATVLHAMEAIVVANNCITMGALDCVHCWTYGGRKWAVQLIIYPL
jgi:hypothetical protein